MGQRLLVLAFPLLTSLGSTCAIAADDQALGRDLKATIALQGFSQEGVMSSFADRPPADFRSARATSLKAAAEAKDASVSIRVIWNFLTGATWTYQLTPRRSGGAGAAPSSQPPGHSSTIARGAGASRMRSGWSSSAAITIKRHGALAPHLSWVRSEHCADEGAVEESTQIRWTDPGFRRRANAWATPDPLSR